MTDGYRDFLRAKAPRVTPGGIAVSVDDLPPRLFDWQAEVVRWALEMGKSAIFADCGLGKSAMQLAWAQQVPGRVLILAPLAVAQQTADEAAKFGVGDVSVSRDGTVRTKITISNYEQAQKFDPAAFDGVVLDESSILKSYMGKTKRYLLEAFADVRFRLCCTATPAPNDHLELGNHAEFLGVMSSHEMIARWFISDQSSVGTYRLKGHAVRSFWDWVSSWARCIGRPSDLGHYSDEGYELKPLHARSHVVNVDITEDRGDQLFRTVDMSATKIHEERRRTAAARAARVAELVAAEPAEQWLLWTETNYESLELRNALACVGIAPQEVAGSDSDAAKTTRLLGFASGDVRVLITKPKIAGFGLNWQGCARMAFVAPTYSFEAYYQAVRRCWRFGQERSVYAHMVMGDTEAPVYQTLQRKAADHEAMKVEMFAAMRRAQSSRADAIGYHPTHAAPIPAWLRTA